MRVVVVCGVWCVVVVVVVVEAACGDAHMRAVVCGVWRVVVVVGFV